MSDLPKLTELADNSKILFRLKTVFPFQIFPSFLTIKAERVEYAHHHILGKVSQSASISDIKSVSFSSNLLLASVLLLYNSPLPTTIEIHNVSIPAAQKAVNIIEGLVVSHQKNVEVSDIPRNLVVEQVDKIGDNTRS